MGAADTIPVIDFGPALAGEPGAAERATAALRVALTEIGFYTIVNHGVPSALVHEVLVLGMTMEQIGERRGVQGQRWIDYFARRFKECLDRLALMYGFATERR